ncbi:NSMCE4A family protein [Megaselia abdita]
MGENGTREMQNVPRNKYARKQKLAGLVKKCQELNENIDNNDQLESLGQINEIIRACDEINNSMVVKDIVNNTTEICMDVHILRMNHELVEKVMKLGNVEFSEQEFSNAILGIVKQEDGINWEAFEDIACRVCKTARFSSSMLGAFDFERQPSDSQAEKPRTQRQKKTTTQEMRPENVNVLDKQDKGVQKVNLIFRQFTKIFSNNNYEPIPFYQFVIDPTDFMITVDNVLQLSFLAKDGNVVFLKGEDGYPALRPATKEERKDKTNSGHDAIILNMAFINEMIEFYGIEESMIKLNREELEQTQVENQSH